MLHKFPLEWVLCISLTWLKQYSFTLHSQRWRIIIVSFKHFTQSHCGTLQYASTGLDVEASCHSISTHMCFDDPTNGPNSSGCKIVVEPNNIVFLELSVGLLPFCPSVKFRYKLFEKTTTIGVQQGLWLPKVFNWKPGSVVCQRL